jgi:hypothetical protein
LVLDRGDSVLGSPVDGSSEGNVGEVFNVLHSAEEVLLGVWSGAEVLGLEFSAGQISKLVEGHVRGVLGSVVDTNKVQVLDKGVVSLEESTFSVVVLAMLGNPLDKQGLVGLFRLYPKTISKKQKRENKIAMLIQIKQS